MAEAAWRMLASASAVVLVAVYAVGSGLWVSRNPGWYAGLARPSWQPPDAVFGLIWPYNFVALAVVGVLVAQRADPALVVGWLVVAAASVACALGWAYLFHVVHRLDAAALALACAAGLTAVLVALTWPASRAGVLALLPYLAWVCLATSLAFGYARLND
jgi:tryptophan-rich sensory protein